MKAKVSELYGLAIDYAVAKTLPNFEYFEDLKYWNTINGWSGGDNSNDDIDEDQMFSPSNDGRFAMQILEQEGMGVEKSGEVWRAHIFQKHGLILGQGHTPEVAIMRCYLTLKEGEEVDVPEWLLVDNHKIYSRYIGEIVICKRYKEPTKGTLVAVEHGCYGRMKVDWQEKLPWEWFSVERLAHESTYPERDWPHETSKEQRG